MAKRLKGLVAPRKAVDPTLDALFAASAGPVKAPPKSRYSALLEKKPRPAPEVPDIDQDGQDDAEGDDEVLSEISEELDYSDDDDDDEGDDDDDDDDDDEGDNVNGDDSETSDQSEVEDSNEEQAASAAEIEDKVMDDAPTNLNAAVEKTEESQPKRERKRKRKDENDDLEDKYMSKLVTSEETKPAEKRQKGDRKEKTEEEDDTEDDASDVPVHETLAKDEDTSDLEKAARTCFLANVSTEAVSSKSAKKTLLAHLSSVLDKETSPAQTIESIRFRSLAFGGGSMPKRAAFITKNFMDATTKSANAYVVYSSAAAARKAATKLNGTEVLGRHIRVDSVAHPSPTDHRRCVFVGNLGFVDDETVLHTNADGETKERKRNKIPSDIEEGLWRTFGKQGRVENVRVVRDPKTRVGKGFAYVQFYDGNDVESALLLNEKKFPPMLPRALRVTRAKDPRKTTLAQERSRAKNATPNGAEKSMKYRPKATPEQQSMAGRTGKLFGRAAATQQRYGKKPTRGAAQEESGPVFKTPEQVVFEGRRASSKDGRPKDLKLGKKSKKPAKPQGRSAKRAAAWKKNKGT